MTPSLLAETLAIPTADGLTLRGTRWRLDTSAAPSHVVIIAHGLGEYHERYAKLAEVLAKEAGSDVVAFDFRGHGRSPGRRGVVRRYEDFQRDWDGAAAWVRDRYPQAPIIALGHSNGGLIVLQWALNHPGGVDGIVLSNPMLRLAVSAPRWKIALGRLLLTVAPWITLATPLRPDHLSRDPQIQSHVRDDPHVHNRISPPLYFGMIEAGREAEARFGEIPAPILLLLSGADPIVDHQAALAAFERSANPRKTLILLPEAVHELFQDLERDRVMSETAAWVAWTAKR